MEQERTPIEQEGMALAAKAPEDDTPEAKAEATTQQEGNIEEMPGEESPADSYAGDVDRDQAEVEIEKAEETEEQAQAKPTRAKKKGNFFGKTWEFIVDKAEFTVPLFFVLSLVMGLIVGYSVMGDGPVKDIFNPDTWTHIVKLIFG
jgi:hypothetical protein